MYNYHCWYTAATERPGASLRERKRNRRRERRNEWEREREKEGTASNYLVALGGQSPNLAVVSREEKTSLPIVVFSSAGVFVHRGTRIIQRYELMINRDRCGLGVFDFHLLLSGDALEREICPGVMTSKCDVNVTQMNRRKVIMIHVLYRIEELFEGKSRRDKFIVLRYHRAWMFFPLWKQNGKETIEEVVISASFYEARKTGFLLRLFCPFLTFSMPRYLKSIFEEFREMEIYFFFSHAYSNKMLLYEIRLFDITTVHGGEKCISTTPLMNYFKFR